MRRFFKTWSRPCARIFSGTALAIASLGAANVGAAVVMSANSDNPMTSYSRTGTDLLIDWNQDFVVYSGLNERNVEHPALAALEPEETQAADVAASNEEAASNDAAKDNDATDADKEAVANDRMKEDDATASTEEANSNNTEKDNDATDATKQAVADDCMNDDATASTEVAADQNATPDNDATAASEDAKPETTDDTASHGANATDKTSDTQGTEPEAKSTESETAGGDNASPAADPSLPSSMEEYYRYRYEPIDGQYGDDRNSATEEDKSSSTDESSETDSGDESGTTKSAESDDDTAGDTSGSGVSSTAVALQTVLSRWADDYLTTSLYGRNISLVMGLLEHVR